MHGSITPIKPEKPTELVVRTRTITLTNRAPIRIVEDKWPVLAEGNCGSSFYGDAPWGWKISIRVRAQQHESKYFNTGGRYLIHAKYNSYDETKECDDDLNQTVRVGRLLTGNQAANDLWKHIFEVGEELRSRIGNEPMRRYVTYAVDACFAKLPAHDNW
jgi:hypothetical protein